MTSGEALFHVAEAEHWALATESGTYDHATRGVSLDEVGFIHLSTAAQWPGVLEGFYADHEGALVLLTIDPSLLTAPVRWEVGDPATGEEFPHLYGPLPVGAVTDVRPVPVSG